MTPTPPNAKLSAFLASYRNHHQNPRNQLIHYICVPAILFAATGILAAANFGATLIAIAACILYYSRFGQKIAMQMGAILLIMLTVWLTLMPSQHLLSIAIGILVAAWAGQFAGHMHEGSKPSFMEDLQYLLIGPLYVLMALKEKYPGKRRPDSL